MMILTFRNSAGEEYAFSRIITIMGMDIPAMRSSTKQVVGQDGSVPRSITMPDRNVDITWDVYAANMADRNSQIRDIMRILSPKLGFGVLRYRRDGLDVALDCITNTVLVSYVNSKIATISAEFTAYDPFFYSYASSQIDLEFSGGLFKFPAKFPAMFGTYTSAGTVINTGDADTPVIIRYTGTARQPEFINHTTGESIKLLYSVPAGYTVEINTAYLKKTVTIIAPDGTRTDGAYTVDYTSDFWQLVPGENTLEYTAGDGVADGRCSITYNIRYVGVR